MLCINVEGMYSCLSSQWAHTAFVKTYRKSGGRSDDETNLKLSAAWGRVYNIQNTQIKTLVVLNSKQLIK